MPEHLAHGENLIIQKLGSGAALSWVQAVYLYDNGDPSMVALMIERDHTGMLLEDPVKKFLVQVVSGTRKSIRPPNLKGDLQYRLNELLKILYVGEMISLQQSPPAVDSWSDSWALDPADMIRFFCELRKTSYTKIRERIGVSERTIEKDLADLRKRLKKYPEL